MERRRDPRTIVTPYAFQVHPDLLGVPLATPWQRLAAIGIDLVLIALLSQASGFLLALAIAGSLLWMSTRPATRVIFARTLQVAVGCLGVLVLAVTLLVLWFGPWSGRGGDLPDLVPGLLPEAAGTARGARDVQGVDVGTLLSTLGGVRGFRTASGAEDAQRQAAIIAERLLAAGLGRRDVQEFLMEMMPRDAPWADAAGEIVAAAVRQAEVGPEAVAGPEASPGPETAGVVPPPAGEGTGAVEAPLPDTVARLEAALAELRAELDRTGADLHRTREALREAQRSSGFFAWLWNLIDDSVLGFGWGAIYLTVFHTWWRGQSVGKRLLGIRVVMLDKRPLNWWLSFERVGGYAAGLATGLLGFAQIFWDPNRQAIHDKVSETVVIQDRRPRVPGPWISGEAGATGADAPTGA